VDQQELLSGHHRLDHRPWGHEIAFLTRLNTSIHLLCMFADTSLHCRHHQRIDLTMTPLCTLQENPTDCPRPPGHVLPNLNPQPVPENNLRCEFVGNVDFRAPGADITVRDDF
jgi:hypothetical protein